LKDVKKEKPGVGGFFVSEGLRVRRMCLALQRLVIEEEAI
jgi:hypothetical protein